MLQYDEGSYSAVFEWCICCHQYLFLQVSARGVARCAQCVTLWATTLPVTRSRQHTVRLHLRMEEPSTR